MAQQIRLLVALGKEPISILSITCWLTSISISNSSSRELNRDIYDAHICMQKNSYEIYTNNCLFDIYYMLTG